MLPAFKPFLEETLMAAPASTLQSFRICGFVDDLCADGAEVTGQIIVSLLPSNATICDPTNGAFVQTGVVQQETFTDGCFCTCELFPNTADDPANALQSGSYYRIQVPSANIDVNVVLDLETLQALPTITTDCGDCIPLKDLLPVAPSVPPSSNFCTAVAACLETPTAVLDATDGAESLTITFVDGTPVVVDLSPLFSCDTAGLAAGFPG